MANFPFLYLNHGSLVLDSMDKCDGAYVGFADPVPDSLKRRLVETCPEPIKGFASFAGGLLAIESPGDVFGWTVLTEYGTPEELDHSTKEDWAEFGQETADRFSAAVEQWVRAMHALHPIVFFMGPSTSKGGEWDGWSRQRFTETVVPFLERLVEAHPELATAEQYDEDELDYVEDEVEGELEELQSELLVLQPLRHGHVACMLHEFEPDFEIPVAEELRERLAQLIGTFQL